MKNLKKESSMECTNDLIPDNLIFCDGKKPDSKVSLLNAYNSPMRKQLLEKFTDNPEDFCQECYGSNPTWTAPDELWNKVVGSPEGILCPLCFQQLADAKGINTIFRTEEL